jgi:hypothetical protein
MTTTATRPPLREVPLTDVLPVRRLAYITMSVGQWDGLLAAAYAEGFVLLELDDDEQPVRAYRRITERDN